jgi:head-tail adaptor
MVSITELARMRADVTASLTDTATIQTRSLTNDGAGNAVEAYSGSTTVACRLRFDSGGKPAFPKQRSGEQAQPQQLWIVTLPYNASVNETDRLTINGEIYEVVTANEQRSLELCKRVLCKRI